MQKPDNPLRRLNKVFETTFCGEKAVYIFMNNSIIE